MIVMLFCDDALLLPPNTRIISNMLPNYNLQNGMLQLLRFIIVFRTFSECQALHPQDIKIRSIV